MILKIISYQRLTPGQQESFEPSGNGFSVGRGSENDWTLPDPQLFMSGVHCTFENRDGTWFITDTSTNGVFLNGADERLGRDETAALNTGDRIRLGDYELEVMLDAEDRPGTGWEETETGLSAHDLDALSEGHPTGAGTGSESVEPDSDRVNKPLSQMDSDFLGSSVSIDELFDLDEDESEPETPPSLAARSETGAPLRQQYTPPKSTPDESVSKAPYGIDIDAIPDDWDEDTGLIRAADLKSSQRTTARAAPAEPEPVQSPSTPPAPAPAAQPSPAGSALKAFARGAGLEPSQIAVIDEDAFFNNLGEMFRSLTEGLMQAIASRSQIKSEFRLEQTMIAPVDNNPFKFSASPDEAMERLFDTRDKAYLSGAAAAAEAIDDINAHQMAVVAGTEAALKSILKRFNPEGLERQFDSESILGKLLPMAQKSRCWDFYRVLFDELAEAADDDFQQLFGAEFSRAYENQLDRLKVARKDSSK